MNKIKWQQKVANAILKPIHEMIDCSAILAGGAPRDWYHGREARDLDIYINASAFRFNWLEKGNESGESVRKLLCKIYNTNKITKLFNLGEYVPISIEELDKTNGILCIYETTYKDLPIQFIITKSTYTVLNEFSLSLSKFWYHPDKPLLVKDSKGQHCITYIHRQFNAVEEKAYNQKKVLVYDDIGLAKKYLEKIKKKYDDFDYVSKSEFIDQKGYLPF